MMSIEDLRRLLGRTLVVVAHPDDECILCGGLLQKMCSPVVVYATDGSPQDPYFWRAHGSRAAYRGVRQEESRRALAQVGLSEIVYLADRDERLVDQELFRNLGIAYELLRDNVSKLRPDALLTLAYEGGHPDHDSCSFLCSQLAAQTGLPAWEAPLYRRRRSELSVQEFIQPNGTEIFFEPNADELARKRAMCLEYSSQGDFLKVFGLARETFRPQAAYDYHRPPHDGPLNYEQWQWSMTGRDVCAAFAAFEEQSADPEKQPRR